MGAPVSAVTRKPWTADELHRLPEGWRYEIDEGATERSAGRQAFPGGLCPPVPNALRAPSGTRATRRSRRATF